MIVNYWTGFLSTAVALSTYIEGTDEETQFLRRTIIRYMVLNQALVFRDISMQVRKRFPTFDTLLAADLMTEDEFTILQKVYDPYSRYWIPYQWCFKILYEARRDGKIIADRILLEITEEIRKFRQGLTTLLKYDWVPIPLVYTQLVFLACRLYFMILLIARQFFITNGKIEKIAIDLWIPITSIFQFIVYIGWLKVAESFLNPLGEEDEHFECNYIIDRNLHTGFTLVDEGNKKPPIPKKDTFWGKKIVAPLYSFDSAKRKMRPLYGSASNVNLSKGVKTIIMMPHTRKLAELNKENQHEHTKVVNLENHNIQIQNSNSQ